MPAGWTDEQEPGHYRLKRRDDGASSDTRKVRRAGRNTFTRRTCGWSAERKGSAFRILNHSSAQAAPRLSWECGHAN